MLYFIVNNFSVISGPFPDFLGGTSTKPRLKCLAQGHKTVFSESQTCNPFDPMSNTLPLRSLDDFVFDFILYVPVNNFSVMLGRNQY